MKGIDTSALLEILEGSKEARQELKRLRGTELASTEANLLELACLAARAPGRTRLARLAALPRLRRRLTVLPLDARAVDEAARHLAQDPTGMSPLLAASLGALEAAGCDELLTTNPSEIGGRWRFKVRRFGRAVRE